MQNCFAKRGNRCTIATYGQCPDNCSFYKTKHQFNEDFKNAKRILDKRGLTARYRQENPTFDKMCKQIWK